MVSSHSLSRGERTTHPHPQGSPGCPEHQHPGLHQLCCGGAGKGPPLADPLLREARVLLATGWQAAAGARGDRLGFLGDGVARTQRAGLRKETRPRVGSRPRCARQCGCGAAPAVAAEPRPAEAFPGGTPKPPRTRTWSATAAPGDAAATGKGSRNKAGVASAELGSKLGDPPTPRAPARRPPRSGLHLRVPGRRHRLHAPLAILVSSLRPIPPHPRRAHRPPSASPPAPRLDPVPRPSAAGAPSAPRPAACRSPSCSEPPSPLRQAHPRARRTHCGEPPPRPPPAPLRPRRPRCASAPSSLRQDGRVCRPRRAGSGCGSTRAVLHAVPRPQPAETRGRARGARAPRGGRDGRAQGCSAFVSPLPATQPPPARRSSPAGGGSPSGAWGAPLPPGGGFHLQLAPLSFGFRGVVREGGSAAAEGLLGDNVIWLK